jgi:hypothetical protein
MTTLFLLNNKGNLTPKNTIRVGKVVITSYITPLVKYTKKRPFFLQPFL